MPFYIIIPHEVAVSIDFTMLGKSINKCDFIASFFVVKFLCGEHFFAIRKGFLFKLRQNFSPLCFWNSVFLKEIVISKNGRFFNNMHVLNSKICWVFNIWIFRARSIVLPYIDQSNTWYAPFSRMFFYQNGAFWALHYYRMYIFENILNLHINQLMLVKPLRLPLHLQPPNHHFDQPKPVKLYLLQ